MTEPAKSHPFLDKYRLYGLSLARENEDTHLRMAGGEELRSLIVSGIRRLTGRAGKKRERVAILGSGQSHSFQPFSSHLMLMP